MTDNDANAQNTRGDPTVSRTSKDSEVDSRGQLEMRFQFNTGKAGMDDPVQKNVNDVVEKVLKGTAYYKRQQEKQEENAKKVEFYKAKLAAVHKDEKLFAKLKKEFDSKIKDLTKDVDLSRRWIHIDLDMFYVAIELRDNPSLADKPVGVGSSVLSTSNYIARKFGVRSAMPSHVAKLLCPNLILLPVNMTKYREASDKFMAIVEEYDPDFETMGLDEAKLDITEYLENHNLPPTKEEVDKIMAEIRRRINEEIRITASCGCAPNPLLAKLCSEKAKPDGQHYLDPDQLIIEDFVGKLDVRKIPGIGPQSEDVLKGLGIYTAADMRARLFDLFVIYSEYERFIDYARNCHGISLTIHREPQERKSFNISETFAPTSSIAVLHSYLKKMAESLVTKIGRINKHVRGIRVTIKFQNFKITDKSVMLAAATNCPEVIFKTACELLYKVKMEEKVRLIGLSVKDFVDVNLRKSVVEMFEEKAKKAGGKKEGSRKEQRNTESLSIEKGAGRLSTEELEKELDDLEAVWFERLDGADGSEVLANATNLPATTVTNRNVMVPEIQVDNPDKDNPFYRRERPMRTKEKTTESTHSSKFNSKAKITNVQPKRVITLEEQFRNSIAEGAVVAKDDNEFSEPMTPSTKIPEMMECPICNKNIQTYGFLSRFNKHIDECLIPKKSRGQNNISEGSDRKEPKRSGKSLSGFFGTKK